MAHVHSVALPCGKGSDRAAIHRRDFLSWMLLAWTAFVAAMLTAGTATIRNIDRQPLRPRMPECATSTPEVGRPIAVETGKRARPMAEAGWRQVIG